MHDGTGKTSNRREAFGLDDFAKMMLVEITEAIADFL